MLIISSPLMSSALLFQLKIKENETAPRVACFNSCAFLVCYPVSCYSHHTIAKMSGRELKVPLSLGVFLSYLTSPFVRLQHEFSIFLKLFFLMFIFCRQKFCQKTILAFIIFCLFPKKEKNPRIYSLQLILENIQEFFSFFNSTFCYWERAFEFVTDLNTI